ncbi:MAG TPA: FkbM family methyltransferase [Tepidisphaeraceae bacterium]|nr:FkbM family methyltransferase [Tepidisphaeraceae bacterium]
MAIDGGAATGTWARGFKRVYPNANVLCIEPREDAQADLHRLAGESPGITVAKALVGATAGEAEFYVMRDQSSMLKTASGKPFGSPVAMPVQTIDGLIAKLSLPMPDLIKLDLQGAELEAIMGAPLALEHATAVLAEVSFLPFQENSPLAGDIVHFLAQRDFVLYDIFSLAQRPLDGALAQADFLFLKKTSDLLLDHRWSTDAEWT